MKLRSEPWLWPSSINFKRFIWVCFIQPYRKSRKVREAKYKSLAFDFTCYHQGPNTSRLGKGLTKNVQKSFISYPSCCLKNYFKWDCSLASSHISNRDAFGVTAYKNINWWSMTDFYLHSWIPSMYISLCKLLGGCIKVDNSYFSARYFGHFHA